MRVLLMNQFFWPDSAATSQLLTDVARDLVSRGYEVHVICGGTYAETDPESRPDVVVHRVQGFRFSRSAAGRILSYATFYIGATWKAFLVPKPDAVLTLTTPPLLSVVGALLKVFKGSRLCIWEMDVYPDVAVDLGYIKAGGIIHRVIGIVADWSRRNADAVIVLGECMRARLLARGIPNDTIATVENWADSTQIVVAPRNINPNSLLMVYSGNLGLAHDVETLTGAIRRLRDDARFRFLFVGGGSRRAELASFLQAESINSVDLRAYVPRAELGSSLGAGDIGVVTQRAACCGSVVPSKVYGLLAAGRPILFVGPGAATPASIVRRHACGWHIENGDVEGLVSLLNHLGKHPEEISAAGKNGRLALEREFDRPLGTARIINQLVGTTSFHHSTANNAYAEQVPPISVP
ncbi:glycosyltransferase family 4 protein [Terriglobus roseus]|uniref:Glycosyltransferase involved in cell wall bisynthesis n=1 Tax=Terriglobus roseus TaxID=392734 RepID=A0A1G7JCH1_9BACT|nr:glycosyltransferase family 4 protein [Terriglobus roseus]SDF22583.1 Glycosyltransferase involved in cell wall bisynthesis [Terriglobus roseus]